MADVIQGITAVLGAQDISGFGTGYDPEISGEVKDFVPFNASMVQHAGAMPNGGGTLRGVSVSYEPQQTIYADSLARRPLGLAFGAGYATDPSEGTNAFLTNSIEGGPQWGAMNGELAEWTLSLSQMPVLGKVFAYGTTTATATSTGIQMGAIAAGQTAYALLQVPTATSGTYDLIIESDDNSGFTSATTRFTFTQVTTTATYEFLTWQPNTGETDDYWRASWTQASTPSHLHFITFGIF